MKCLQFNIATRFTFRDFEDFVFEGLDLLAGIENCLLFVFNFFIKLLDFRLVFDSQVLKLLNHV